MRLQSTLTVMSLNLAHGRRNGWHQALMRRRTLQANLAEVAGLIRRERPDVVAIQEADRPSLWSGRFDHVQFLAGMADAPYFVHGEHVKVLKLTYGTALLSRCSLADPVSHTFFPAWPILSKGMVVATIGWPGATERQLDMVSVHLGVGRKAVRQRQSREIVERLKNRKRPLVLMGDFNCGYGGREQTLALLMGELNLRAYAPEAKGLNTFPLLNRRLDWILISPELDFVDYRTLSDVVSDHRPVVATLRWARSGDAPRPGTAFP